MILKLGCTMPYIVALLRGRLILDSVYYLHHRGYVLPGVCLSVCLSLSRIAQKVVDEFDEIFRDVVCD